VIPKEIIKKNLVWIITRKEEGDKSCRKKKVGSYLSILGGPMKVSVSVMTLFLTTKRSHIFQCCYT